MSPCGFCARTHSLCGQAKPLILDSNIPICPERTTIISQSSAKLSWLVIREQNLSPSAETDHGSGSMSSLSQSSGGMVWFFRLSFLKLLVFPGDVLISEVSLTFRIPKEEGYIFKELTAEQHSSSICSFAAELPSPAINQLRGEGDSHQTVCLSRVRTPPSFSWQQRELYEFQPAKLRFLFCFVFISDRGRFLGYILRSGKSCWCRHKNQDSGLLKASRLNIFKILFKFYSVL